MTSTVCVAAPTSSVASARTVCVALSTRPVSDDVRKPSLLIETVYDPGCRFGSVYSPSSLLLAASDTFVAWLTTAIFAPGTTAPEVSRTVPVMVPRSD